jgi:hypothetical protein
LARVDDVEAVDSLFEVDDFLSDRICSGLEVDVHDFEDFDVEEFERREAGQVGESVFFFFLLKTF